MHALEIKDKGIYLDGVRVKGVVDYKLEETACGRPQINMTLVVENAKVTPKEEPEVISPGSALKELIEHITGDEVKAAKVYYGVTASKPDISEQIRQIVREELAAASLEESTAILNSIKEAIRCSSAIHRPHFAEEK
ncbi:hypothetical protein [Paenibacillus sp. GM2]|uniref:hypothetical protein n=1 Tax=Paenibacillus sp. GM2 TaxID=1622070 RepID=UPI000838979D|nr:hypothetical protein [Paenibacillus sp. GM2]